MNTEQRMRRMNRLKRKDITTDREREIQIKRLKQNDKEKKDCDRKIGRHRDIKTERERPKQKEEEKDLYSR